VNEKIIHCCELMDLFLEDQRIPILYLAKYREYNIPLLYKNKITALQGIMYCPWCSKKLPERLRDKWFEILEKEYNLDDPRREEQEGLIPEEFEADEWWKKRGL